MKKAFSVLLLAATCFAASAQSTSPRFANPPKGDNSANTISFQLKTFADTAGTTLDTLDLYGKYQQTSLQVTVTDSCFLRAKSVAGVYYNDFLFVDITNTSGSNHCIYLGPSFVVSTGTNKISLTSAKKGLLVFRFDGSKYIETSRNLNY